MSGNSNAVFRGPRKAFPSIESFESGSLDVEAFDHEAHVFIAWKMLSEYPFAEATRRFLEALKRLTRALGVESKYHETISCFYMALIAERRAAAPEEDWETFTAMNPDLLGGLKELMERHYSSDRLWSDLARKQFLLPDRNLQPDCGEPI